MTLFPDHLISWIATISSRVFASSSASSCILPGLSNVYMFQVPIWSLWLLFICPRHCLFHLRRPDIFVRWDSLACILFLWMGSLPLAQPQPGEQGDLSSRFPSSRPYRSLCKPQGSGTCFGLPRVFYFLGAPPPYLGSVPLSATWGDTRWETSNSTRGIWRLNGIYLVNNTIRPAHVQHKYLWNILLWQQILCSNMQCR
jgi:hypothetical protein